jgi:hypothetical protein
MKVFYIHVPKTGGTSINDFFAKFFKKHIFHIEGSNEILSEILKKYDFVSGHVSYGRLQNNISEEWIKVISFREPYSFVISHLSWIRKLADPGEEKRLLSHPKIFQKVALKMKTYDFSDPNQINDFINWLEKKDFWYLHNTQTLYLDVNKNVEKAISLLDNFELIGITEKLVDFLTVVDYELNLNLLSKISVPKKNINKNKYGFNINDEETKKVLNRLIDKDEIIYNEAKKKMDSLLKKYEILPKNENIIGWVDEIKDNYIKGWVKDKYSYKHLEVGAFVNNKLVSKSIANIYRKNLKLKKIHFTGCCEFRIPLRNKLKLKKDDVLEIKELSTLKVLPFSSKFEDNIKGSKK